MGDTTENEIIIRRARSIFLISLWQMSASDVRRMADHYAFTWDPLIQQDALAMVYRILHLLKQKYANAQIYIDAYFIV